MRYRGLHVGLPLMISGCVTVTELPRSTPVEMADSRIELGLGYLQQGNMSKARENLYRAARHAPDYHRAQLALAHYFERVGETAKARKRYKKTARQHPSNGDVLHNFATFLCKQQEYDVADSWFKRALQQTDYHRPAATLENAALCAQKAGHLQQAENYFIRTLEYEPGQALIWLTLIRLQLEQGKKDAARESIQQFRQRFGHSKHTNQLWLQVSSP